MTAKIRYAVVGLGDFAQEAVLPSFKQTKNSVVTALVSSDPLKLKKLGVKYGVTQHYGYDRYDACLRSGEIDAVYIVLPNSLHKEYAVRAANAGIHVLCEKPMAISHRECEAMISAAQRHHTKLMIAYRLHFEKTNLDVIHLLRKGRIGEPKFFSSVFSHQVHKGNIRTKRSVGGGCLWDLGIYCLNAARYIFGAEPTRVFAITANTDPATFKGVDEIAAVTLHFPGQRLAQFTASQGAAVTSRYHIVGTKGDIQVDPAYDYTSGLAYTLTVNGKAQKRSFPKRDQIAAEVQYFSNCILKNKQPEPSGNEGRADVRIIEALYQSAKSGRTVSLSTTPGVHHPKPAQAIQRPAHGKVTVIHAEAPSVN